MLTVPDALKDRFAASMGRGGLPRTLGLVGFTMALVWMAALTWAEVPVPRWHPPMPAAVDPMLSMGWVVAGLLAGGALALWRSTPRVVPASMTTRAVQTVVVVGAAALAMVGLAWATSQAAAIPMQRLVADYSTLASHAGLSPVSPDDPAFDAQGHLHPAMQAERCARAETGWALFEAQHLQSPTDPGIGVAVLLAQHLNQVARNAGCVNAQTWKTRQSALRALAVQAQQSRQLGDGVWVHGAQGWTTWGTVRRAMLQRTQDDMEQSLR